MEQIEAPYEDWVEWYMTEEPDCEWCIHYEYCGHYGDVCEEFNEEV